MYVNLIENNETILEAHLFLIKTDILVDKKDRLNRNDIVKLFSNAFSVIMLKNVRFDVLMLYNT